MKVLICGDRNWKDRQAIQRCVFSLPQGTTIIEGEARGADRTSAEMGAGYGLTIEKYPADWNQHGRSAGPIRNRQMLREGKPDLVVFFHNNLRQSKGTRDMVKISCDKGIPVINGRAVTDWPSFLAMYGFETRPR